MIIADQLWCFVKLRQPCRTDKTYMYVFVYGTKTEHSFNLLATISIQSDKYFDSWSFLNLPVENLYQPNFGTFKADWSQFRGTYTKTKSQNDTAWESFICYIQNHKWEISIRFERLILLNASRPVFSLISCVWLIAFYDIHFCFTYKLLLIDLSGPE